MKNLSGALLYGRLGALPIDNRLGWKGLPGTNTLAYYENSKIMAVKSFITLAPGVNVIRALNFITYEDTKIS
jgi:hypothetical protein